MNFVLDWLRTGREKRTQIEQKSIPSGLVAFHSGGLPAWSSAASTEIARNGYCRNPVVYRCVNMIAGAAASIPLHICEVDEDCDEHPFLSLLASPNEFQSGAKLLECLYGHLLIAGNAYLMRVAVNGEIKALYSLDPTQISVAESENGWPTYYRHNSNYGETTYRAVGDDSQILHMSLFNPMDAVAGMSPLTASHMAVDIHNSASEWNKALLDNSARPSGALVYASSSGENLSDEQFGRLKQELEEGYSGSSQAGRPMVLEGGLDWKAMGYSPRDMDFLEAKNGAAREITLAFGVPPMLLGIPGDNTYSNYQEANRAFWLQTVVPLVTKITGEIGNWLANTSDGHISLEPHLDKIDALASERDARWSRINGADFLTDDEKRQALGLPKLNGFEHAEG